MNKPKRVLSVFTLVMINVIAVDSLRTLPISAKLGTSLISYYLLATFAFFIPVALISAELASAYPHTGGIYVWVREAFGKRTAFITIWLQWIYNVVWYPTMLAFIATAIAHLFAPDLAQNKTFLVACSIILFWLFTFLNCFGMRVSSIVSILGASLGTILPMIIIIALGALWLYNGAPTEITMHSTWWPDFSSISNLSIFSVILFGLLGMEMSAVHAEEVRNPQRDYPRALLYSTILIFSTLMFGSLSIALVIPTHSLNIVSGLIDAYDIFFKAYNMPWMTSIIAMLIVLGGISGVAAWIIGPTKGLMIAARDNCLPEKFAHSNRYGAPTVILLTQAIVFTILSTLFILVDSISTAYWMLSSLCAQLALLVYVFMFAAAIKLRHTQPNQPRAYTIPGGYIGIWLVGGIGILCCITAILIGFVPPEQILIDNKILFESFLFGGMLLFVVIPWFLAKHR